MTKSIKSIVEGKLIPNSQHLYLPDVLGVFENKCHTTLSTVNVPAQCSVNKGPVAYTEH